MTHTIIRLSWLLLLSASLCGHAHAADRKSNILVILTDDQRYGHLWKLGVKIQE